ncbi:2-succinyl-5-enolpyruvyl-6-hydroxy-3-cyclohexene-1-carboxylic-acid synthase [Aeromicrobium sp. 636]|uniref:2-succinyl-5-enolpyruvyl-6-hydroxy-3-cyclohexene-1-carboxylate synthase n=1 Tax=Aeromicrobium senzhongii TaxID=2663859 RepID=A0A8I0EXQ3_9ACTN|nr:MULTISPECIES: 2-succinyl-5-enolpyruvyl-6-hydroxy-3-cyclohexene-1-carboxylic-acid synthase [Aeromicrobium]MBC9227342.1 2-succinyl-5-enolpyruvyl-6-hydroxy-3-cyclohexene-1-carboxylic-acid synthase [Aeromicrobium senzhongii]MCQ3999440.1 2-succinyl-5-enolpyruvyl-6-hydroxy-3-cyclohexene-1-carboxylic-acid synthase [Aeromicrobium sp. 636]MTB88248.1 2-succinyl-5-enolpyruvyl-6-hydroxy-3-cyclohexene-1-carboxylic-acid synthase [Aeromicrobium senzhongii]QNL94766.1 2-succinyl-5-enolpyruvyl-6-hydroxy-3-cyc
MSDDRAVEVARRLVAALLAQEVTEAVLSPGSRSGPLALALYAADEQGLIRLHVRVDEREAGYLALGLAKASGRLTPVITTSGTAVANLHPALLEALHAGVPLLAVTADRPARLRGTGANQTTIQPGMFPGITFTDRITGLAGAVREGGPVHLNVELDEPLVESVSWQFPQNSWSMSAPVSGRTQVLESGPRTVLVAGDGADPALAAVAQQAGWPILAEPSSGLRSAPTSIACGRIVLGGRLIERIERIVSAGHPTLSRPVTNLLTRTNLPTVHVGDASTFPGVPGANVTFADRISVRGSGDESWVRSWIQAGDRIENALLHAEQFVVAKAVWEAATPGLLVLGSSNPIRDVDLVAPVRVPGPRVLANRGLAGIDGTVSTAIGAALTSYGRAIALMGDLTFLHGANGLLMGPIEPRPDLTIVVLNDDGGGIFHTLEQGSPEYSSAFERVFGTPTRTKIDALCAAHGIKHRLVQASQLEGYLSRTPVGIEVLEVQVTRAGRRALQSVVSGLAAV